MTAAKNLQHVWLLVYREQHQVIGSNYRLFLPQLCDIDRIAVDSRCTVSVLLKDLTQQVAHGLCNDNAPSMITQGMTGKN